MRPTYQAARHRENKPLCEACYISVDPRSREYRAWRLCESCATGQVYTVVKGHMIKEKARCDERT